MLSSASYSTTVFLCLGALLFCEVASETCITCMRDTLEACIDGERAAEFEGQQQKCSPSLPYCEVTVQEWLKSDQPGAEPEVQDTSRGCIKESRFTCSTVDDVRTCTATCQGDLCNDFDDVAERVRRHEKEVAEQTPSWVVPVAVVGALAGLAVLAAVAFGVYRSQANRRKARDLKMGAEAEQPLKNDRTAPSS